MASDDPRVLRTRSALRAAIVELARERPVREVTMSALARSAGVHRSTVYEHTTSPEALLVDVLRTELDAVREETVLPGLRPREVALDVLTHLETHETIYLRELADAGGVIRSFLTEHFRTSIATALAEVAPEQRSPLFLEVAPAWIASASVAAMTVWLSQPPPRDPLAYLAVHEQLLPCWWPRSTDQ